MKALLMYRDRDLDLQRGLPWNGDALTQDLELDTLFNAMALGDEFLFDVAKRAVLSAMENDRETTLYRQDILRDCLKNPSTVKAIYDIAVESIEGEKKIAWGYYSKHPDIILYRAVELLRFLVGKLRQLRGIADEQAREFGSDGFSTLFAMLRRELDEEYFARIQDHLKELRLRDGVFISAELGKGNKGTNYLLRKAPDKGPGWMKRVFAARQGVCTFYIAEQDQNGARALSELRDKGLNLVANALAQSTDHILSFFAMLRAELGFYIGCLNLHGQLGKMGEPICFPEPTALVERRLSCRGLYDVCLALTMGRKVVGNDVDAEDCRLVIVTGANKGGKSTFLRSIGLAQLMMQCGMFVSADSFCANMCDGLFTHYRREEDVTMRSGKLDEELGRMSDIVDHIAPNSLLLFNESFSATNEREGSEIARQIIRAMFQRKVKVFFVTHLSEFAHRLYDKKVEGTLFLRAERQPDGGRTFRMIEGEPLRTSFGGDLYRRIFEVEDHPTCDVTAR